MLALLERPGVLIVVVLGILIFGAKRLPEAARSLGRSARILKAETKGLSDDSAVATQIQSVQAPQPVQPAQPVAVPTPLAVHQEPVTSPGPDETRRAV